MASAFDVIVIGAGPAGLATAACCKARGLRVTSLERSDRVGSSWRSHYERLHLHTTKRYSALPMMPWPDDVPTYPSREQVVSYLERYAARFGIEPRFGETVQGVHRFNGHWSVPTSKQEHRAPHLVIATGYNRVPNVPAIPGRELFRGEAIHSSAYRNGHAFKGKRALVVGAGNSGAEIALDLWESGADTTLSVRGPIHVVPRDVFGIPAQYNAIHFFSRIPARLADRIALGLVDSIYGDLSSYGLRRPSIGPITQVVREKRIPLVDIGTVGLVQQRKILVHPAPAAFTERGVRFTDGSEKRFDLVVLATGYRPGLDGVFADAKPHVDRHGIPICHGTESGTRGLYFVGYRNPLEGQLNDIAKEAARVASQIALVAGRS